MSKNHTYSEKGGQQVDIAGMDEKWAYTLAVTSALDGVILLFQQVWSGKSDKSLPSSTADGYRDVRSFGFKFTVTNSPKKTSHFSMLKTMKDASDYLYSSCLMNHH
jgi:hypothetical protein